MRVLYFGIYDPLYARNWVLINGLKRNNVEVIECRVKQERGALIKLFLKFLRSRCSFDAMIVGFPGQEVMFLARFLTKKPIIFDVFTSHYGGYILDRRHWKKQSIMASYYRFLDKWSCKLANIVLLDTDAHIDFFIKEYGFTMEKFKRIWVGANDEIYYPGEIQKDTQVFKVIFFGTYIPLQGVEYIVRTAEILKDYSDIVFKLIGQGQERSKINSLVDSLKLQNIVFEGMLTQEKLAVEIARADVSLGIFGNTPKASLIIPNKVFIAAAMKKAIITSDTPAIRELFREHDLLLVDRADPESLADAILKLKNNPSLREILANNGYNTFQKNTTPTILGLQLKNYVQILLSK